MAVNGETEVSEGIFAYIQPDGSNRTVSRNEFCVLAGRRP